MSLEIDEKGVISLYQGDSGEIIVSGLDETKKGEIFLAIQDKKRNLVGSELRVLASNTNSVSFVLTPDFTDLLKVSDKKPYEIFYYGIKFCDSSTNVEDTLFIKNSGYGDLNQIIVYPKKVQGI